MKFKKKHSTVNWLQKTEGGWNEKFTSAKIQNQLISFCNDIILEKLVEKIGLSYFQYYGRQN